MLLVALVLERTVLVRLDQLGACRVEDVAGGTFDLSATSWNSGTAPSGAALLKLESLELVHLVQQPSGGGVEPVVGGRHVVQCSPFAIPCTTLCCTRREARIAHLKGK